MNQLHYTVTGIGDPVVFLHGFMEDASSWEQISRHFCTKTCITIDLHGHGRSFFNPNDKPSIALMAEQVSSLIDDLGIGHYQLVGHSLGGYVGCELLKTDSRLEQLIFLHSHPWPDSEEKKQDRNRVIELVKSKPSMFIREAFPKLFAFPEEHCDTIERYCRIAEKMDPLAIAWTSAAMRDRPSYVNILSEKSGQVSIIQGELDPLIPTDKLHAFANEHHIYWFEIARCGHMGQEENPEKVVELLKVILG